MVEKYESHKLCYTIHKCSGHTEGYIPENIMVNSPMDQLSRWFTDSTSPGQYIMLKLKSPSIVETILFGKYIKVHINDLKDFQVFGGLDENNMALLLTGGLKADGGSEMFRLRHRTSEGLYLPVNFIKIVPLQSWGRPYNFTIWYVELHGKNQEELVNTALDTINLRKEEEAVRVLLKHLRRRCYKDAFEALSRETGVTLEGPVQARLWNALVEKADYKLAERIFEEAVADGELDWYSSWQSYTPQWRELCACSTHIPEYTLWQAESTLPPPREVRFELACADRDPRPELTEASSAVEEREREPNCEDSTCCHKPGPRGGHQLVVDAGFGTLYLFGGWNGTEDLDDLWSFCTINERWTLLCEHSGEVGGPGPRSCHKMVFDPVKRRLYTLGRYLGSSQRIPSNMNSDMCMYDISRNDWSLLCEDTAAVGGPRLVFDHQMCIDPDTQTIYVFGGRILPSNTEEVVTPQYSGLFAYYISTQTWQPLLQNVDYPTPAPRVSHSMLFHPKHRRLYIFAGQRNKEHLLDLWWCDVNTGECQAICCTSYSGPPPAAGFTQRATLDPETDEMFVLSVLLALSFFATGSYQRIVGRNIGTTVSQQSVSKAIRDVTKALNHADILSKYIQFPATINERNVIKRKFYEKYQIPSVLGCIDGTQVAIIRPKEYEERYFNRKHFHSRNVQIGMSKEKDKRVYNTLWMFSLRRYTWSCIYRNDHVAPDEPQPRFAHQLVYDPIKKIHYLSGGNPGNMNILRQRLDDLWSLQLVRPSIDKVCIDAKLALREEHYKQLAGKPAEALRFLRNELREALDDKDPQQVDRFQKLPTILFSGVEHARTHAVALTPGRTRALLRRRAAPPAPLHRASALHAVLGAEDTIPEPTEPFEDIPAPVPDTWDVGEDIDETTTDPDWDARTARVQLYDKLCQYFRPSTVPPKADIMDLIAL